VFNKIILIMKKITLLLATIVSIYSATAQVKMPAPSTTQTIKQDFGLSSIELTYSRPNLKGRKIIGGQDAYGSIWRTGANAATLLRFNDAVTIGGKLMDTGNYVLYTIPQKSGDWDVIINKGLTNWGADGYKETEDVVRLKATYKKVKGQKLESLSINFDNIKPESLDVLISWDDWCVSFPITTNIKDKLRGQIETALQGEKKPYQQAANFYYDMDKNYPKALDNVNKAIEGNAKAFWLYLLKAKIQKELGQNADAIVAAKKCIELATAAKNDAYVSQANDLLKALK
jgi:tetratricopeptide (TPR) repeat protein